MKDISIHQANSHATLNFIYFFSGLYPGILGVGPFLKLGEKWPFVNENSRGNLQNLGVLPDFKETFVEKRAHILPLSI